MYGGRFQHGVHICNAISYCLGKQTDMNKCSRNGHSKVYS